MRGYLPKLNIFDKILKNIFKRYSEKIYRQGLRDGFNWNYERNMGKMEKIKISERQ